MSKKPPLSLLYISIARIPSKKVHTYQILKMCEAFVKKGAMVVLLHQQRKGDQAQRQVAELFNLYDIHAPFEMKPLFWLDSTLLGKINSRMQFYWRIVFYLAAVMRFVISNRNIFNIIYCRDKYCLFLLAGIKTLFQLKVYYEAHNAPSQYSRLHSSLIKKMDGVVVTSEQLKTTLLEQGITQDKILVARNGVDTGILNFFASARNINTLHPQAVHLCYTGNLYPWKGAEILLRAMALLPKNFHLMIIGGHQEDIEYLQKRAYELGIHNVEYKGFLPRAESLHFVAAADVLVLPNSGKHPESRFYTSPLKLFEYMASGRPIVASRLPSLCEILKDGENAVLVEPDDPEELALGIKRVIEHKELAQQISKQALIDVTQYTWDNRAEKILKFIQC